MDIQVSKTRRENLVKLKAMDSKLYERLRYGYPNLETTTEILSNGKVSTHGFPMIYIYYEYHYKYWSCIFRNPQKFTNPEIRSQSAKGAAHEMLDFIVNRIVNNLEL